MSHASRSKKQNKNIRAGYEPIISCSKCNADVFYSHEVKKWLESRTRFFHSNIRCQTIKKNSKVAQTERNKKTLRPEIIQELKHEIASFDRDKCTDQEVAYEIFLRRKFEIDRVSIREIAVAFFPQDTFKNERGETEPTHRGIQRTQSLLRRLRKNPYNNAAMVFSKKFEDGEWYYYNLQTKKEFEPVRRRLERNIEGIQDTLDKSERILEQTTKERVKAEEEFRKKLAEVRRRKKNNNNNGGE